MNFREDLNKFFNYKLNELFGGTTISEAVFEKTPNSTLGDLSTNFAMQNFKFIKDDFPQLSSPFKLAEYVVEHIAAEKPLYIKGFSAAQPGFINVFIDFEVISKTFLGNNTIGLSATGTKKVIIEHTSVNPNKSMHVGHLRNAVLGDFFVNLYRKFGNEVEVQNYIDDTGVQVVDTLNALLMFGDQGASAFTYFDDFCWEVYAKINKLYEEDPSLLEKRADLLHQIEKGESPIAIKSKEYVKQILTDHLNLMKRFGINYDLLVFESDILKTGLWQDTYSLLKTSSNFVLENSGKKEGCWILKSSDGKYEDKVFIRKDGTIVYTAKDTAYHLWKFGIIKSHLKFVKFENFDVDRTSVHGDDSHYANAQIVINVIDERQTYPQQMVKQAIESLGFNEQAQNLKHIQYGVVNLSADTAKKLGIHDDSTKTSYSMSGRKGIGIKARDLLEQVKLAIQTQRQSLNAEISADNAEKIAIGAIKHYLLKFNAFTEIIFDLDTAISIKGNTGPYLLYSLARANSIKSKLDNERSINKKITSFNGSEQDLLTVLMEYDEILSKTYTELAPSIFTEYVFRLASAFHLFYEENSIIQADDADYGKRVLLLEKFITIMNDALGIMGIIPPEKM